MKTGGLESADVWGDQDDPMNEVNALTNEELVARTREFEAEIRKTKTQITRINNEIKNYDLRVKENKEKLKLSTQLPHMVANVGEILDVEEDEEDKDTSGFKQENVSKTRKAMVVKTTGRHTIYLPVIGMIEPEEVRPGDLIAVNKESFIVYEKLPPEYDSRVKAMEIDERPTEEYSDIGGLDKQIQELIEAIVLPMTHKERFDNIGIRPPKGLLMHGPPGTGKTMMARACAAQTKATFLKLAGPQLVQMFIGDGAKMVRDAFDLAREKAPAIIFIDELDAVGTKRGSGEGETREVHRTMLELLNQLDGFTQDDRIKVIAATNRPDILDPALLRSGRLDRKIELPLPNEEARARILQIHSRKMNVNKDDVNFEELARSTQDFNGAQLKAVCVEAGMVGLRRGATTLRHEDFVEGIQQVQSKKKASLNYYA
ncbi:26s protease regulatory subunit 6a [Stylonychia lemnae]|uniref:26s protease regulatory subunit 6a n=1 Tax=Stylonychia lemnae TaxID=5949 RepID=A0A078ASH3_STYLE|nr:26s protease regulatory subunit 6a [Stylonychia lemnae]|eukprot:CDW84941.1 26s protease regulatory subunit 6a [Stylonychia lemnae]